MKITISIPDSLFADAESLVTELKTTRSDVYARALTEFIGRHVPDRVTALMDQVVDDIGARPDPFPRAAARGAFSRTEW